MGKLGTVDNPMPAIGCQFLAVEDSLDCETNQNKVLVYLLSEKDDRIFAFALLPEEAVEMGFLVMESAGRMTGVEFDMVIDGCHCGDHCRCDCGCECHLDGWCDDEEDEDESWRASLDGDEDE